MESGDLPAAAELLKQVAGEDSPKAAMPPRDAAEPGGHTPVTREDVDAAVAAPEAKERLGDVRAGSLHALEAYRFLRAKRQKTGRLSPEEQLKFEGAEQALAEAMGQKGHQGSSAGEGNRTTDYPMHSASGAERSTGLADGQDGFEAADSPGNVLGTTYQPVPEADLLDWARRGLASAERAAGGRGTAQAVQLAIENRPGTRSALRFQEGMASLFGKRVLFVKSTGNRPLPFDGMVNPDDPNSLHALEAYRFLRAKRQKTGRLSPEEQLKFERAEQALAEAMGQKGHQGSSAGEGNRTTDYENHLARLRREHADAPEDQLAPRAALSAVLETGISRLEFLTMGARLPGVQAALAKYGKYGRWGAGAVDKAGAVAGGTLLEPFENSALEISSGIFSAIKRDLPGPDWDKVAARETAALGDYASVTTALTLVMGLGHRAVGVFDRSAIRSSTSGPIFTTPS